MSVDLNKNTYTIKSVNRDEGTVTVIFDCDGKTQTLANAPLDDADNLKAFISQYCFAYIEGLKQENTPVDDAVSALVGKSQTAVMPEEPLQPANPGGGEDTTNQDS